jgi:molecular chaperone GrpE
MTEDKANRQNMEENQDRTENEVIEGEIVDEAEASTQDGSTAALAEELQQAEAKAKEYFEGWQRERADFANYKRRIDRDQQAMAQNMKGDIIKKYLTVLDDLERALKVRPTEGPSASWANGIELIFRKLQNILEAEGVQRIPAEGVQFDPNMHEAITHEDSPEHESGQIIEVFQQGYTLGDRVLRPAMVRVAR